MDIQISGSRSSSSAWHASNHVPAADLPALTAPEKEVVQKLGITEDGYARSAYAERLTREFLKQKALRVGNLIQTWLQLRFSAAEVEKVWLKTFEGKFRVDVQIAGKIILFFVNEDLVDDLFESGSREAEEQIKRIVDVAIASERVVV